MFANLLPLFTRRSVSDRDYDRAFVQDVAVQAVEPRSRRVERALLVGWILIVIKCLLTAWAVSHYHVPIRASWIILPTIAMAAACTVIYLRRP